MAKTVLKESVSQPMSVGRSEPVARKRRASVSAEAERSFEALFLEHWASILRLLVRLVGDPVEAEDLALETFWRLYQRPPRPGPGHSLGGWLHRVATNLGLHSMRSSKCRERYEQAAGEDALEQRPDVRPAEIVAGEEDSRLARVVLAQMKERQAQLLIMRYSGMAYKEIAAALGLSPTSVGPLLLRAEREFEKRYRAKKGND